MTERRLRLVQFTKSFHLGGTEGQVVELVRGLQPRHDVSLAVLDARGPLLESVWKLGIIPKEFPLYGSLTRPNSAFQVARAAHWFRSVKAELVHVHDFYSTLIAVPAAKLAGCKVVVGRLDLAHWHGAVRRAVLAQLTRSADGIIANAEAIRRMLERSEAVESARIAVIHNGLDVQRFDERRAGGLAEPLPDVGGAPVVLHVANMNHPVKRQEDLIDAIALLRDRKELLHAFLVGDGPRRAEVEARAKTRGVANLIHFLKHRTDVPAIYAHARFGVLCSTAEGLSNAVIEGMAARLPMVVTDVGGNPDLIEDGARGLVVQPKDPDALARAFARLLHDSDEAARMGEKARAFVEQSLSLRQLVANHEAFYARVLEAKTMGLRDAA
ncbi:MAG: glycosyltransferase [Myxococcaceae bacterium]